MNRYLITYRDDFDPINPQYSAYEGDDEQHAIEQCFDENKDFNPEILKIVLMDKNSDKDREVQSDNENQTNRQ